MHSQERKHAMEFLSFGLALFLTQAAICWQVPQKDPSLSPAPTVLSVDDLIRRANTFNAHKSYPEALEYYRAAAARKPDDAGLRNRIAIVEMELQHWKAAVRELERAIRLDPRFADAYNNLGVAYYEMKKLKKAIKLYDQALLLRKDASFYSNLGAAYFARKDFQRATVAYGEALQLDPDILERTSRTGISALVPSPTDRARFDYVMAKLCAKAGVLDRSLTHLRRAMEEGYPRINDVYTDEEFAQLRTDPRFQQLMTAKPAALPETKVR